LNNLKRVQLDLQEKQNNIEKLKQSLEQLSVFKQQHQNCENQKESYEQQIKQVKLELEENKNNYVKLTQSNEQLKRNLHQK